MSARLSWGIHPDLRDDRLMAHFTRLAAALLMHTPSTAKHLTCTGAGATILTSLTILTILTILTRQLRLTIHSILY